MHMSRDYTQLEIWIEGRKLVILIENFTKKNPKKELSDLTCQIRKAATAIASSTADGCRKQNSEEIGQFMSRAGGSLCKLENQLNLSLEEKYISKTDFVKVNSKILLCKKLIGGFINYYKKIENEK